MRGDQWRWVLLATRTMKAAVLREYLAPLSIEDVEAPRVKGENDVVVRIAGSGVCHTDVHVWRGEAEAVLGVRPPLILGHEPSGFIEEAGEGVPEWVKPGAPVLVCASGYCRREDKYTLAGLHQLCDEPAWPGLSETPGSYAEYLYVPHYKLLIPGEGLEDLAAASLLTDAGVTAYRAVKTASTRVEPGDSALVVGLGGVGLFALQLARVVLNADVTGVDISSEKVEFAAKIFKPGPGDHLVNASEVRDIESELRGASRGRGFKAIIDLVGSQETMEAYLPLLAKRGIYVVVGLGSPFGPPLPALDLILGERLIAGVLWGTCTDVAELAELARRGLVDYRSIVTRRIPLEEASEAIERLDRGEVVGRQVIDFTRYPARS